jgi:thioredoxin-related protein
MIQIRMLNMVLLLFAFCSNAAQAAEAKTDYAPDAAQSILAAACKQAASESKMVFMKSGYPECGYCRKFDLYHSYPEVRKILDPYYVIISIDTQYMPDGKKVFEKYAKPGAPSWVILTPKKKVLFDSYSAQGNVGFPVKPHETIHYLNALATATPRITDAEMDILLAQLQKAYGR